jgi:hypothetical protein
MATVIFVVAHVACRIQSWNTVQYERTDVHQRTEHDAFKLLFGVVSFEHVPNRIVATLTVYCFTITRAFTQSFLVQEKQ